MKMQDFKILVNCSARLHMGFFDLNGSLGRKFGSIGLSLETPNLILTAGKSQTLQVTGISNAQTFNVAQAFIEKLNIQSSVNLHISEQIPQHAGLGSGTQFALAVGAVLSRLYHLNLTTRNIASLMGRGSRSGIGIAAFDQGGVLIDGGRKDAAGSSGPNLPELNNEKFKHSSQLTPPPLLARYNFPEQWHILLILDNAKAGIHGEQEAMAFKKLPVFSESLAAHLCRHLIMQAMPALLEEDLAAFGNSIQELQAHTGDYFAPIQGGRYASKNVGQVLQYLKTSGAACFGQSSWGATGFAVFESQKQAENFLQKLKLIFTDPSLAWLICTARNHGAEITQI